MIGHTRIGNENTKMFAGPHNGTPRGALSAPVRPDGSDVHHIGPMASGICLYRNTAAG